MLVAGDGLALRIGAVDHAVTDQAPVVAFSGEDNVVSRPVSGPVRVFNVMTRRAILSHALTVIPAGPFAIERSGAILADREPVDLRIGQAVIRLGILDLALIEGPVRGATDAASVQVAFNARPGHRLRA